MRQLHRSRPISGLEQSNAVPRRSFGPSGGHGQFLEGLNLIAAIREATGAQLSDYDFYQHFGPEASFSFHQPKPLTVRQLTHLVDADLATR